MIAFIACLAAITGYYAWQFGRYERATGPREAHGRALADAAALAMILAWVWIANRLGVRWGLVGGEGSAASTIGVVIGMLIAGPTRRAVLGALRMDAGPQR